MPTSKQGKKRVRLNDKRQAENKVTRSSMRSAMKKVLVADSKDEAKANLPMAMKRIDKAAKHHVIHDNAAARYKSRLERDIATKA